MCGIAGIYNFKTQQQVHEPELKQMCDRMIHRGPNGEGYYTNGAIGLGHRRLSIIDIEGGKQPMSNTSQTIWITFNGEIYNFKELRDQLSQKGYVFKTRSDTEAIIYAYEEWGVECLEHLEGMFAFAIWDNRNKKLFAARDRFGEKPFFYFWNGEQFIFASEIQALLRHQKIDQRLDARALFDFFHLGYILSPKTIYQDVAVLPQAHYLLLDSSGIRIQKYWDLAWQKDKCSANLQRIVDQFDEIFHKTVHSRLVSDVPLGAFLSGGIDSTSVVQKMTENGSLHVITCSARFQEQEFDENRFAIQVAEKLKTNHHSEFVDSNLSSPELLYQLISYFGEPFGDSSMIPTYYISKLARKHVTVALSGDGGDETLGGYQRYLIDAIENKIAFSAPHFLRKLFYPSIHKHRAAANWGPAFHMLFEPWEAYFWGISAMKPNQHSRFIPDYLKGVKNYHPKSTFQELFQNVHDWDYVSALQYIDMNTYLVDDILTKVDRMSMANSLEVRVPFLDHHLVEWLFSLPSSAKYSLRSGKKLLKSWLNKKGYSKLFTSRKKRGFSIPEAQWLKTAYKSLIEETLSRPELAQIFYTNELKKDWNYFLQSDSSNSSFWWNILIFGIWNQQKKK